MRRDPEAQEPTLGGPMLTIRALKLTVSVFIRPFMLEGCRREGWPLDSGPRSGSLAAQPTDPICSSQATHRDRSRIPTASTPSPRSRDGNPQCARRAGDARCPESMDRPRVSRSPTRRRHGFSCITHRLEATRMRWRDRCAEPDSVRRDLSPCRASSSAAAYAVNSPNDSARKSSVDAHERRSAVAS